jgi:hypothetical protein
MKSTPTAISAMLRSPTGRDVWIGLDYGSSLPTYSLIVFFKRQLRPTRSPIRRELIFGHHAFEVFGLTFDAIPNSSVRLDRQLLNDRINGRLLNGHSLRSLNQVTNVIFWLVNMSHLSTRSLCIAGSVPDEPFSP